MFNNRMTNRKRGEEWYTCQRCGFNFPRSEVIVQNGMTLCTRTCYDIPSPCPPSQRPVVPYERNPDPLPERYEEL